MSGLVILYTAPRRDDMDHDWDETTKDGSVGGRIQPPRTEASQ
jgi:hypothetical protein